MHKHLSTIEMHGLLKYYMFLSLGKLTSNRIEPFLSMSNALNKKCA